MAERIDNTWPAPIVALKSNFIYLPIPKVACSSIKSAIAYFENIPLKNNDPHQTNFPIVSLQDTYSSSLPSFAFVRHPISRLYSCWKDKVRFNLTKEFQRFDSFYSGMPFEAFVKAVMRIPDDMADGHFRSQHLYICHNGFKAATYIAKLENSTEEWTKICEWLRLPALALPTRNKAQGNYNHSKHVLDMIYERYETDFNKFNYEV